MMLKIILSFEKAGNMFRLIIILLGLSSGLIYADDLKSAVTTPIPIAQIKDYSHYSPTLKKLITEAWELSSKNLTYQFGSDNPENKGMDCSGTIYYLLKKMKVDTVPRASNDMYQWVKKSGVFHSVHHQNFSSSEFSALQPGDLLFWSGTYTNHNPEGISHVMIYLGNTMTGRPIMFGSSDGRSYLGKKMWGVSVFDFQLPNDKSNAKFVGYSCIPTLTCTELMSLPRER